MSRHVWLTDIAAAIADGHRVDWVATEARASSPEEREVIERLRSIERIVKAQADAITDRSEAAEDSLFYGRDHTAADGTPVTWGPLTVLEEIGRGSFGRVYRAYDPRLDRHVALKILRRRDSDDLATQSAIIEEGRLMARVRHPNVITVYGAERIDGRVGVWMEFVEGRTLEEHLNTGRTFDSDAVIDLGKHLCAAVEAVHQAGLLHRDIKTQNVMIASDGRVMLSDFGEGRPHVVARPLALDSLELAGTPLYLAPEVLLGQSHSARTDIYSLGVVLYRLATRSFPVTGRSLEGSPLCAYR